MIYTTRYSVASKLPRNKYLVVRTSLGGCRFCKADHNFSALAPTREMMDLPESDGDIDFINAYEKHLEEAGLGAFAGELENLVTQAGTKDIVLCCFCDVLNGAICHRRVFAEWYHAKTGIMIPELAVVPSFHKRRVSSIG